MSSPPLTRIISHPQLRTRRTLVDPNVKRSFIYSQFLNGDQVDINLASAAAVPNVATYGLLQTE